MSARILVVDDMLPNVKLLEAKLTKEYYEVITAHNGREALEKARAESPDIILLDVMMPEMDGFETCRQLRADPTIAHIPVVMVTALSEKKDRVHGLEAGADDFLTKPINDVALMARVKSLIRLKVMIDELRLRGQTEQGFGVVQDADVEALTQASVLVIDDDVVQSRAVSEKLSPIVKEIKLFSDPELALEEAGLNDYDAIIVSTQMIEVDGLRICSQLRSNEKTRNKSLIVLVDEQDTGILVKALEIGVNDYVMTPIDVNELIARVKTQVRRSRYQDQLRTSVQTSISLAVTDGLTGLYNRRYMDTHLETMINDHMAADKSLAVMIMDIDHFKHVNDTYGHNVGDEIIKQFAERIMQTVRPSDLAVRYGGEEFVVIMPGTSFENAKIVADRVRANIENVPFKVSTEEGLLTKTCSVGYTSLNRAGGDDPGKILKRSDEALYEAKNSGRNLVCGKSNSYPTPEGSGAAQESAQQQNADL